MNFNFIFNEDNPFWLLSPAETASPSLTDTPNLETIATTATTATTTNTTTTITTTTNTTNTTATTATPTPTNAINVDGVYLSPPLTNPIFPLDDDFIDFHHDREQENALFPFFPPLFDLQHQQQDLALVDPALFQFNDNDILNDHFFHSAFFNTMDFPFNTNETMTISVPPSPSPSSSSSSSSSSSPLNSNEIISSTTHRPKNRYLCKLCHNDHNGYSRPQDLKRHIDSYHNSLYVHDCKKCDRKYRRKDILKRHIRIKHN